MSKIVSSSRFKAASLAEWGIADAVGTERRALLLEDFPLPLMARQLIASARVVSVTKQWRKPRLTLHRRIRIELETDKWAVDRWFNGRSGYRAQYYLAPTLGEAADRCLLAEALEHFEKLAAQCPKLDRYRRFAQASLLDASAKTWVRQGWTRTAKKSERHLLVLRWAANQNTGEPKARERAAWAAQLPVANLELIGGWIDDEGQSLGSLKPLRSTNLHELGFT